MGQLDHVAAGDVHNEDIEISRFESTSPCKRDVLAILAPRGIHCVTFPRSQAAHICSVNIHSIYLRCTAAPRDKYQILAGTGIYLRLHFQRAGMSNAMQIAAIQVGLIDLRETRVGGGINE